MANAPTIEKFGIQSGTDRTLYIQWAWKKKNTKEYRVFWEYATGDGIWFSGSDTKVKSRVSTYTAPDNAKKVAHKTTLDHGNRYKARVRGFVTKKAKTKDYGYWW